MARSQSDETFLQEIFPIYFPKDIFTMKSDKITAIKAFSTFFSKSGFKLLKNTPWKIADSIQIDFEEFVSLSNLSDITTALIDHFENTISCMEASISLLQCYANGEDFIPHKVYIEIMNLKPLLPMKNIKANCINKFISVRGTVVRTSKIQPQVITLPFMCNSCSAITEISYVDGIFSYPAKCTSQGCRGKRFTPLRSQVITMDWQEIKLQETDSDDVEAGRVPRTLKVELTNQLVDRCIPGDVVEICGLVKCKKINNYNTKMDSSIYVLYLEANSVRSGKTDNDEELDTMEFSARDMYAIQTIAHETNIFPLIIQSLCPSIYGHEIVKAGLALALSGGTNIGNNNSSNNKDDNNDNNANNVRGSIHVLLVGDPGLGKSQLLKTVATLCPRGVYVCGNITSTAGLTVTMTKERDSQTGLEAGALVLSDNGICCIDELDKMGSEQDSLLEAMEQQSISVAKSGMLCTLSARTTIVAAANPNGGNYNRGKTIMDNLKMNPSLLSRFDLIFILLDESDSIHDRMISKHIMKVHKTNQNTQNIVEFTRMNVNDISYSEKLKQQCSLVTDPLPPILLRKYITYARKYVFPKLSKEAGDVIKDYYLEIRSSSKFNDTTPVTTRKLESLIRLAQARARLELREIVTEDDAKEIVLLMKETELNALQNDMGCIDFTTNGKGKLSKSKQMKGVVNLLNQQAAKKSSAIFTLDEIKDIIYKSNLKVDNVDEMIHLINEQNYILLKGNKIYQLQTSQFSY